MLKDDLKPVNLNCAKCGNSQMLLRVIKEYMPTCTHDEIWVNKDSIDFLAEYSCPQCGHRFRSEQLLGD